VRPTAPRMRGNATTGQNEPSLRARGPTSRRSGSPTIRDERRGPKALRRHLAVVLPLNRTCILAPAAYGTIPQPITAKRDNPRRASNQHLALDIHCLTRRACTITTCRHPYNVFNHQQRRQSGTLRRWSKRSNCRQKHTQKMVVLKIVVLQKNVLRAPRVMS
jgi:hypothetical protein